MFGGHGYAGYGQNPSLCDTIQKGWRFALGRIYQLHFIESVLLCQLEIENILQNAIPSAVSNVCCLLTLMIIEQIAGLTDPNILGTAALLISGFVGFVTLFRICLPFDKIRKIIFGGCAALFVLILLLAATVFSGFFELAVLPWWLTLTVVLLMLISIPLTWRTGQLVRRIFQRRQNPKPKKKRGRA